MHEQVFDVSGDFYRYTNIGASPLTQEPVKERIALVKVTVELIEGSDETTFSRARVMALAIRSLLYQATKELAFEALRNRLADQAPVSDVTWEEFGALRSETEAFLRQIHDMSREGFSAIHLEDVPT